MSLLKSAYRPYAQLDDDDNNDLLKHQQSTAHFEETSPITSAAPADHDHSRSRRAPLLILASALVAIALIVTVAARTQGLVSGALHLGSAAPHGPSSTSKATVSSLFEEVVVADTVCGRLSGIVEDGAFAFKVRFESLSFRAPYLHDDIYESFVCAETVSG